MQKMKWISVLLGVGVVCLAGVFVILQSAPTRENSSVRPAATPPTSTDVSTATLPAQISQPSVTHSLNGPTIYTLAQVARHAAASSCWSVINGGVYDLTNWIAQHPGGQEAILGICGADGSSAFNNQHGEQSRVASILATFKIGTLTQ